MPEVNLEKARLMLDCLQQNAKLYAIMEAVTRDYIKRTGIGDEYLEAVLIAREYTEAVLDTVLSP